MSSVFDASVLVGALCSLLGTSACERHKTDFLEWTGSQSTPLPVGPTPGPPSDAGMRRNPFSPDQFTLNEGRVAFLRYNCAGCHGDHGGGGMGPSLRDEAWIYGKEDAQIFGSIAEGRAHGMPAWGGKLPEDTMWKLVTYIASFRREDEPEKPDQTIPPPPTD
jgi:cytochrome c oxidase cbb3-type subunit 3